MLDNKYTIHIAIKRHYPGNEHKEGVVCWTSPNLKNANSVMKQFKEAIALIDAYRSKFKQTLLRSKENNLQT
jgi:hypothetical protein